MSLSVGIIAMLRGESGYPAEWEDLVWLARKRYQEGRSGRPYEPDLPPEGLFPADVAEIMENFLRQCWEQGRLDAGEVTNDG